MERSDKSPDELIRSIPDGVRGDVARLDAERGLYRPRPRALGGQVLGGTEQRVIGYGACVGSGRAALPLTGSRSAWPSRRHTFSLFVTAVDDGLYLDKRYADRLGKVKVGSANVTFKRLADVDQDALREMATRARELLDSPPT